MLWGSFKPTTGVDTFKQRKQIIKEIKSTKTLILLQWVPVWHNLNNMASENPLKRGCFLCLPFLLVPCLLQLFVNIICFILFQSRCWLPCPWYSLCMDWLRHMLWKLCWYHQGMPVLNKVQRRWSKSTCAVYFRADSPWSLHCHWHILWCSCGDDGCSKNLAAQLSYPCQTHVNKSKSSCYTNLKAALPIIF